MDVVLCYMMLRFGLFIVYCLVNCLVCYCKYLLYFNSLYFIYIIYFNIMLKFDKVKKFIFFFIWLLMIGKIFFFFYFLRVLIFFVFMLKKIMLEIKWYYISYLVVVY